MKQAQSQNYPETSSHRMTLKQAVTKLPRNKHSHRITLKQAQSHNDPENDPETSTVT